MDYIQEWNKRLSGIKDEYNSYVQQNFSLVQSINNNKGVLQSLEKQVVALSLLFRNISVKYEGLKTKILKSQIDENMRDMSIKEDADRKIAIISQKEQEIQKKERELQQKDQEYTQKEGQISQKEKWLAWFERTVREIDEKITPVLKLIDTELRNIDQKFSILELSEEQIQSEKQKLCTLQEQIQKEKEEFETYRVTERESIKIEKQKIKAQWNLLHKTKQHLQWHAES